MCKELVKWWARYKAVLQISVRSLVLQSHCLDWNYLGHLNKNELVGQIHFSGCPETFSWWLLYTIELLFVVVVCYYYFFLLL